MILSCGGVQRDGRGDGEDDDEDEAGEALAVALRLRGSALLLLRECLATLEVGVLALATLALDTRDAGGLLGIALVYLCLGAGRGGGATFRALALPFHLALAALLELFGFLALLFLVDGVVLEGSLLGALVGGALARGFGGLAIPFGVAFLPLALLGAPLGGLLALLGALLLLDVRFGLLAGATCGRLALRHL